MASVQTKTDFVVLEHLSSRPIVCICASEKKMFVIFEDEGGVRKVSPLHSPDVDEFDFSGTYTNTFSQMGESFRATDLYSQTGKVADIKCSQNRTLSMYTNLNKADCLSNGKPTMTHCELSS